MSDDEEDENAMGIEDVSKRPVTAAESQFGLEKYDILMGPFEDYSELIVQCVLVVGSLPRARWDERTHADGARLPVNAPQGTAM